ncbi:mitochondrial carrier domain-containing protein [Lipomyces japonicus]|uniref:mitochondrial carrier domain-containing protein n=1 Tax=Lipomyces japonicus TaxID=56871 RepID=UPI0034D01E65
MSTSPAVDSVAQAVAGAGGGALAMVITYPLITLSTRAQTERRKSAPAAQESSVLPEPATASSSSSSSSRSNVEPIRPKLAAAARTTIPSRPGLLSAAGKIIQREGIGGLYAGLESALFGISVTNFIYYYFYEATRAVFAKRRQLRAGLSTITSAGSMSTIESMLAGAIAGSATVLFTNPIWVVNTRMTVRTKSSPTASAPSTLDTIREILHSDGVRAFLAGLAPALILVINPILQYTIFERLRAVIERKRKLRPLDFFVLGAIGKLVATVTTYPYITIKSRMQVQRQRHDRDASRGGGEYASTISALRKIASEEGCASLYNGLDSKIIQSVLTSAFLFYFKEQLTTVASQAVNKVRRK